MGFRFRLQTLLDYREKQEEALQQDLAVLRDRYQREDEALQALELAEQKERVLLRSQQTEERLDVPQIDVTLNYIDFLGRKQAAQRDLLAALANKIESCREELVSVMRARKALEKLKEKQLSSFQMAQKRTESRVADEISTGQYNWRSRW